MGLRPPARILVRLPNWLGDALMARPALAALRRSFPDAAIAAAGPGPLVALLAGDGAWNDAEVMPGGRELGPRMRARRFDLAILLPPSFSSAWLAWRWGARRRVGFRADARAALLTDALPRTPRGDRHLSEEYLSLVARAGGSDEAPPLPALRPDGRAAAEARALAGEGPYVILGPGAVYGPAKRWPAERFAEVARALAARGLQPLVCGAAAEAGTCGQVARLAGAVSLAGRTSLGVQAALAAGATAAVCNDSGLAHLAAAAGCPTVAVFGSTSSAWTAPLGPRVRVVQRPPVCSPCFRRTCRIGYRCLEAVGVRAVLAALAALGVDAGVAA